MLEAFDAMSVSFDVIAAAFVAISVSLELIFGNSSYIEVLDATSVTLVAISEVLDAISKSLDAMLLALVAISVSLELIFVELVLILDSTSVILPMAKVPVISTSSLKLAESETVKAPEEL